MIFNFDTQYRILPKIFYADVTPDAVKNPEIVIANKTLMQNMGIDPDAADAEICAGNKIADGSQPLAQAYAGHQFGNFTMLGDGRAHLLGEHITPDGKRFDIALKGSGQTPFSRRGDGRAALKPMLREYLISEAMFALGIPTTRSLAVVTTGEDVQREGYETGAILMRCAASHIRVGTFEYAAMQDDISMVEALCDYTIKRHYPEIALDQNKAINLLNGLIEKQSDLIVNWMRVGFVHGVMNTDNMTLSGETIDYGPCAFMDHYDPNTVFSSIDYRGRYAFDNQPKIAAWNIARFAETLLPLIDPDIQKAIHKAEEIINNFTPLYYRKWLKMMCAKIGMSTVKAGDEVLITELLTYMRKAKSDYTNFFSDLTKEEYPKDEAFKAWQEKWEKRKAEEGLSDDQSLTLMRQNNPVIIPRNSHVEEALDAANRDNMKPFHDLLGVLQNPYQESADHASYKDHKTDLHYRTFCGT